MAWRRRQHLIFFGYSDAEIIRLGDLTKLSNEQMNELIHSNNLETTEKTIDEQNNTTLGIPIFGPGHIDRHVVHKP